jgi:hypothetical protein
MSRSLVLMALLALTGCVTLQMAGPPPAACAPAWSKDFADRLGAEADALPAEAAAREALAQLAELRGALPRC